MAMVRDVLAMRSLGMAFEQLSQNFELSKSTLNSNVDAMSVHWQDELYAPFRSKSQEHFETLSDVSRLMIELSESLERQARAAERYLQD